MHMPILLLFQQFELSDLFTPYSFQKGLETALPVLRHTYDRRGHQRTLYEMNPFTKTVSMHSFFKLLMRHEQHQV